MSCDASFAALAKTGAHLLIATDADHAVEELARCAETPQLIIQHLDYSHEPLKFYRFIRGNVAFRHIPFLFVVETAFEKATLSTLNLTHYFTVPSPLTYGLLVYALPALGMKLKDSILYEFLMPRSNIATSLRLNSWRGKVEVRMPRRMGTEIISVKAAS